MKHIVFGSSGFLGKHLVKRLDDKVTTHRHGLIYALVDLLSFDNLYFLSSYGNMAHHEESDKIMQANVSDVLHVVELAMKYNFRSFVFISTSSVKLKTQTMYSRSKRAAEEILLSYMEKYNKPICIIRPFSITGVGEQKEHLIPTLIRSCMTGELVNFVANATHDFIDVKDVVDGILNLSQHSARGIFELGTGKAYSNKEVLAIVEKVTGKKAKINLVSNLRSYDNEEWVSKNFRSRSFGWTPKKTLEQSIVEMVKEYEKK